MVAYRIRLMFERKWKKGGGGLQKNERDKKEDGGKVKGTYFAFHVLQTEQLKLSKSKLHNGTKT